MRDIVVTPVESKMTVAYIRSAVAEQGSGLSLRRQRRICEDHARSLGQCLSVVYADAGVSGRAERRPGLDQLRRELAHGRICRVITPAPHVLARDPALWQQLQNTIRNGGASLAMPCDHQAIANQERWYL
jgi:DNA invertase Pin-like site-specific DNA recombinase